MKGAKPEAAFGQAAIKLVGIESDKLWSG